MNEPTLAHRLGDLALPTLVLWGDSDRIAVPEYGRVYATSIPMSRFQVLTDVGHLPQVENPEAVLDAIWEREIPLRRRWTVTESTGRVSSPTTTDHHPPSAR